MIFSAPLIEYPESDSASTDKISVKRVQIMEVGRRCGVKLDELPEGCISHILSLTTPKDTCVCAAVSTGFRSAAVSDSVWSHFLPSNYQGILSRAVHPVQFSSKKDLFSKLSTPLLIDEGKASFMLEKSTGHNCLMLSAEKLSIVWGDRPEYWTWHPLHQSRFSKVAELKSGCWLSVGGTVRSGELQANTMYFAYLIYKILPYSYGFRRMYQEAKLKIADEVISDEIVYLERKCRVSTGRRVPLIYMGKDSHLRRIEEVKYVPKVRGDGLKELALGEFLNDYGVEEEIEILFRDIEGECCPSGLIIEGIEFRPKKQERFFIF